MEIAIGADHAGFEFKEQLRDYISSLGHDVKDFGAYSFDINKEWVKISDTTETIQTTYFKEYRSIIYDDEVKYIGENAKHN